MISEPYWTAAAKHADIVLPITTSFERNDLTMTGDYSNQHLVPMEAKWLSRKVKRVMTSMYSRTWREMLAPGGRDVYTEGKTEMEWLYGFYKAAQQGGRGSRICNAELQQVLGR